jgi:DNA replication protein DnaC
MEQTAEIKDIKDILSGLSFKVENNAREDSNTGIAEKLERFKAGLEKNIQSVLQKTGVPKMFLNPKSNTSKFDLERGYYFHGPVGTGKTDTAISVLKNIILNTEPVFEYGVYKLPENLAMFASVPMMLLNIRSSFKSETSDEIDLIKKYVKPEILIMDDLGTEKVTEWVMQTLYVIINSRYEEEKQTLITSNNSLDEIRKNLNDKIASRITAMTDVIELKGIDRRSGISVIK